MWNFLKAACVTALTVAPVIAKEKLGEHWNWPAFAVYACVVLISYWKIVFRPDERFLSVRGPGLDLIFEKMFGDVKPAAGERFPFRVNVYRPYPSEYLPLQLRVTYQRNGIGSDPDHGKWWWSICGLVGDLYWSGTPSFFKRGDDMSGYRLSKHDANQTKHLDAVLAIPIRRPSNDKESVSGKVTAVLAIDALTPEAAAVLADWSRNIEEGRANTLVDKLSWLSLYF